MKKILLTSFFILLFWALFVPVFEYPDEQAHFATVSYWSQFGKMPRGNQYDVSQEQAITEEILGTLRDERGNNQYTYHPENKHQFSSGVYGPREQEIIDANTRSMRGNFVFKEAARYPVLYYWWSGILYQSVIDGTIFDRLFAARFATIVLGIINVWVAYKIAREIFPQSLFAYIAAAMVLLQPMMSFVMSGVTSDSLHNLLFSLILLFSLRLIKYKNIGDVIFYLIIFTTLDFLTKPQAYVTVPIILLALFIRAMYRKEIKKTLNIIVILSVMGILTGLILDKDRMLVLLTKGEIPYLNTIIHPDAPEFIDYIRYSLDRLIHQNIVWYWGVFKWLGVVLPKPFWWIANRLVIIAMMGLIIGFIKNFSSEQKFKLLFLGLASGLYIIAIFYYDWTYIRAHAVQVAVQARYYFPLLTAHMVILLAGILGFSKNVAYKTISAKAVFGFFIALQLAGLYTIAKSYYDISSPQTLFIQASQYKPLYAKGLMWWIWGGLYLISLISLSSRVLNKKL